ncbi:MAG: hypothetical protein PHO08_18350 [Methylococcales bacterium]|nr:hypothetical protein [Methylococcales bacterium]MDD5631519.1 hypothetical protein [Methylococcales bacterium]
MNINDLNAIEQMERTARPLPFWLPAARTSVTGAYSARWLNSDTPRRKSIQKAS